MELVQFSDEMHESICLWQCCAGLTHVSFSRHTLPMVANACTLSSPEYCLPIDMVSILKSCRAEQRTVRFHSSGSFAHAYL